MDLFDILTMIGGLCLFLFGMNIMGESLERAAGNSLRNLLSRLTSNRMLGFLTGLAVTAVIQSSSATTVMVVGFVNSGLMSLRQAIGVIMGANVGTTVTAWILSLSGIEGENIVLQLLKPTSFTPILALIGTIYYMFIKNSKKKDIGMILLGFAILMFGMDTMSGAVKGLKDEAWFTNMFLLFKNPILGVLVGMILTGIIQSSSASVGILQALSATGAISYGAAIPIIMGQNIGTTVTALLSSVGTTKNARRAAIVHMMFNVIGTAIGLVIYLAVDAIFAPAILDDPIDYLGISICHTAFNILCTSILLPSGALLEKIAYKMVPDAKTEETFAELDERLLATPAIALVRCREIAGKLADASRLTVRDGMASLTNYTPELGEQIIANEDLTDHYEDILGTYLLKLSALGNSEADSAEVTMLQKAIGDFERIADHGKNLLQAAEEMNEKQLSFSAPAKAELAVLNAAVSEIVDLAFDAYLNRNMEAAYHIEPLEEVVDDLKEQMRTRHILRMQQGQCSIEAGFVWSDLLTSLERVSDHCSNLAGCIMDLSNNDMNTHEAIRQAKLDYAKFGQLYRAYTEKYRLA